MAHRSRFGKQGFERQADHQVQRRPAKTRAAPPKVRLKNRRQWPADRAREASKERDSSDRAARVAPIQPNQSGEGGFVETAAHTDAQKRPSQQKSGEALRHPEKAQTGSKNQICPHQHGAPAPAVDASSGVRPEECRNHQREGEGSEDGRGLDAEVFGHRRGQHGRQVVRRCPGQRLRDAQGSNDGRAAGQGHQIDRWLTRLESCSALSRRSL